MTTTVNTMDAQRSFFVWLQGVAESYTPAIPCKLLLSLRTGGEEDMLQQNTVNVFFLDNRDDPMGYVPQKRSVATTIAVLHNNYPTAQGWIDALIDELQVGRAQYYDFSTDPSGTAVPGRFVTWTPYNELSFSRIRGEAYVYFACDFELRYHLV